MDTQKLGEAAFTTVRRLLSPGHAARCLRFLATEHIYRELKPDVFTNNRISSMLDTLKPSKDIIAEYVSLSSSQFIYLFLT